jgi:hypothetical protein
VATGTGRLGVFVSERRQVNDFDPSPESVVLAGTGGEERTGADAAVVDAVVEGRRLRF